MVITFKLIFANHAASYEKALSPSKFPCTLFGVQTPEKGCFLDEIGLFDAKKIVFREGYVINLSVFPLKKERFGVSCPDIG